MKPDVIVTWPKNCDYPLWRQFIHDNRGRFDKVIVGFMETNRGEDYQSFIRAVMQYDDIIFFDAPKPTNDTDDWRNLAINKALLYSQSEWIWFTEQDFYPQDGFWDEVERLANNGNEVIANYENVSSRMHPSCIFMNRRALKKSGRNFGIIPDKGDHFCKIQNKLMQEGIKIGSINPTTYYHYNGLTQNFFMLSFGEMPNYNIDRFTEWLKLSLEVTVPVDQRFIMVANRLLLCGN